MSCSRSPQERRSPNSDRPGRQHAVSTSRTYRSQHVPQLIRAVRLPRGTGYGCSNDANSPQAVHRPVQVIAYALTVTLKTNKNRNGRHVGIGKDYAADRAAGHTHLATTVAPANPVISFHTFGTPTPIP